MIYFIGEKHSDKPIKIGFTNNINQRLSSLRTSTYEDIYVLAILEGGLSQEAKIHKELESSRVSREWFERISVIEFIINNHDIKIIEPRFLFLNFYKGYKEVVSELKESQKNCKDLIDMVNRSQDIAFDILTGRRVV